MKRAIAFNHISGVFKTGQAKPSFLLQYDTNKIMTKTLWTWILKP